MVWNGLEWFGSSQRRHLPGSATADLFGALDAQLGTDTRRLERDVRRKREASSKANASPGKGPVTPKTVKTYSY